LASDVAPCFSLGVRPSAYHPISRRRLAREPVVLNHEGGSSTAMVENDGWGLWKKVRGVGGKGDEHRLQEKDGSVCRVPSPIYPPLPATAQWVRRFMTAPRTGQTQTLRRGPSSHASVGARLRSNNPRKMAARKWITPHIPYVRRSIGSGITDMISTTRTTPAARCPVGSRSWS
jgi:hypothetical protein